MGRNLPTGTVTFLFTDVEGSTQLLNELGPEGYAEALGQHRRVLREAFGANGGVEIDTQGDAFFVAFPTAGGAIDAAAGALEALAAGPIRVRIGIHTGTPHVTDEGYVGEDVHRAARIGAAGHGGQVLVSAAAAEGLARSRLVDLGEHRLKDFAEPVPIFQLGNESFPPLKTISNTNLPRPTSSFVGREAELTELATMLTDGTRLLTLTGPGGTGKTRLAIEAAAELVPTFKAGVFWVGLAAVREPSLVAETIGRTLGAKDGLGEHIGERDMLLVLDNLEQVVDAAPELARLVEACTNLRLLVTSRERLRVRGEVEYAVRPLPEAEAVELFSSRADLEPDSTVAELCRALDNLPLALELAAARTSILSPRQILERISERLDLLKGGRDADPRQLTLRSTIEWSHDLLSADERALFARMAVFVGGCTLEAAEAVADAELDTLASLVDKSLLRHSDERFWMLATIREFAEERLASSGVADETRRRHTRFYRDLARRMDVELRAGEPEEGPVGVLEADIDNVRASVEFALRTGDTDTVREITTVLPAYWLSRGSQGEARGWVERALELDPTEDELRRRLLAALGTIAYTQGDHVTALTAADQAADLATRLHGASDRIFELRDRAFAALIRGDLDTAESLFRERLAVAIEVDNGVATSSCRLNLAFIANRTRRHDLADELLAENLPFVRSKGQARCEANTLAYMAETTIHRDRPQDGGEAALLGATRALQIRDTPLAAYCLDLFAASAAARGDVRRAATILAATEAARAAADISLDEDEAVMRARAIEALGPDGAAMIAAVRESGRSLDLSAALEMAIGS